MLGEKVPRRKCFPVKAPQTAVLLLERRGTGLLVMLPQMISRKAGSGKGTSPQSFSQGRNGTGKTQRCRIKTMISSLGNRLARPQITALLHQISINTKCRSKCYEQWWLSAVFIGKRANKDTNKNSYTTHLQIQGEKSALLKTIQAKGLDCNVTAVSWMKLWEFTTCWLMSREVFITFP